MIASDNSRESSMKNTEISDICPHAELCGGCSWYGVPYEETLAAKERQVRDCLEASGVEPEQIDEIRAADPALRRRYRNKMEYTFGDLVKGGELTLGMHRIKNFLSIVTVDRCRLVPSDFNRILLATLDFCRARAYAKYDKRAHSGLLRNLVLRRGVRTGELLAEIVTTSGPGFDEAAWKEMILGLTLDDRVVGLMHTINDDIADAVKTGERRLLFGRDYYNEIIANLRFRVNMSSFFQTNVEAVEGLYDEALALVGDMTGKTVFDLYCGTGTISQLAAQRAGWVIGIELSHDSVEAARLNARLNGIDNCEFIEGDVFETLGRIARRPGLIIVDPPRAGLRGRAARGIAAYGVPEILYISCNPASLAADLAALCGYGYRVRYLRPYDNFAWTKSIETVALLSKD